jgi:hypothetical protein
MQAGRTGKAMEKNRRMVLIRQSALRLRREKKLAGFF